MYRRNPRADVARLGQVLVGVRWPAPKWQLLAQADAYGADSVSLQQLWSLPPAVYRDLAAVCSALGILPARDSRPQPQARAAAADAPESP